MRQFYLKNQQLMMENAQSNQQLHVPTQRLVIVFQEMREGRMDKQEGEGEVTCLRFPLSHRQAKLHQCKNI